MTQAEYYPRQVFIFSESLGETMTALEGIIEKNGNNIATDKEDKNDGNKMQKETTFYSRKKMDLKRRTIDKLVEMLAACLHREHFSLTELSTQKFDISKFLSTRDYEAINVNNV